MRIFSLTRNEYVEATPDVDSKTNQIVGYTVEGGQVIEPPELFKTPTPIDWEKVRIQAAISAVSGMATETLMTPTQTATKAVLVADALVTKLRKTTKQ